MMKAAELRELNVEELRQREHDLEEQLFRARIQKATGQLDQPMKLRTMRRDLARVKTVLQQKSA
jgi:large subunit ribosomal protein L29